MKHSFQPMRSNRLAGDQLTFNAIKQTIRETKNPTRYIGSVCSFYQNNLAYNPGLATDAVAVSEHVLGLARNKKDVQLQVIHGKLACRVLLRVAAAVPHAIPLKLRNTIHDFAMNPIDVLPGGKGFHMDALDVLLYLCYADREAKGRVLDKTLVSAKKCLSDAEITARAYCSPMAVLGHLTALRKVTQGLCLVRGLADRNKPNPEAKSLVRSACALASQKEFGKQNLEGIFDRSVARDPYFAAVYAGTKFRLYYVATPRARSELLNTARLAAHNI